MTNFWWRFAAFWLLAGLALRVFIAGQLGTEDVDVRAVAVVMGLLNDLKALGIVGGWLAIGFLLGFRAGRIWFAVTLAFVSLVMVAEVVYWIEFQNRLDRLVFHYLGYPREILTFLEEQFSLSWYALPFLGVVWLLYRWMSGWLPGRDSWGADRGGLVAWVVVGVAFVALVGPGTPGHSRYLNQLASNGYLGMLRAARMDMSVWQGAYWRPSLLEQLDASVNRATDPTPFKHLILVVEESFSGDTWWDGAARQKYMPELAKLVEQGIYFDNVYATGSRTTRGLEAILNGFPPLPGIAVTERAGFERLPSLPRDLGRAGFHTSFVYGGWPGFSSFFDYWKGIGFHEMSSRYDFDDRWFETSWGVADEILFDRVLTEMDRLTEAHERVMISALTVTNHRPFDFPDNRVAYPADERRSEYAMAYADWALGDFVRRAAYHPWSADTLIVVVADHAPTLVGDALVPANGYRVPLLFLNQLRLPPRVVHHLGSTMSLPITLLDVLGVNPSPGFYGANLLQEADGVVPVEHNYHVGLLDRERLTVLVRSGDVFSWRMAGDMLQPDQPDYDRAAKAEALFRAAHEGFYR
ncbi:MAG: sulfatase-like hydrolase/transferase [Pseudomonadales bacterium]